MITIKRQTGFIGSATAMSIHVNEEKVEKIRLGQEVDILLPTESATVKVTQFGAKSNIVKAKNRDHYILKTRPWSIIVIILFILLSPLVSSIGTNFVSVTLVYILLIGGFLATFYFLSSYELKKVE